MNPAAAPQPPASRAGVAALRFWFDPVSPFAYLAFERLPQVLQGVSHAVEYRPILFAGLLKHWGQLGPAEIEPKRDWIWRQVAWLAARDAVPFVPPPRHPFNPLPWLRLLLATAPDGGWPGRWACEQVLHALWRSGTPADDPALLARVQATLGAERPLPRAADGDEAKAQLRAATDQALQRGVFGVPTVEIVATGQCFWGQDALAMLREGLVDPAALAAAWHTPQQVGPGIQRPR